MIIDINTLSVVFDTNNNRHCDFAPVKKWLDERKGFLVFGGTKYKKELKETYRYLRLIRLMSDGGMAKAIKDEIVDEFERNIVKQTIGTDCDDQHIIAMICASRCTLLCSLDKRSFQFIKDKTLYPPNFPTVKIYSSTRNRNLLMAKSRNLTNII
ncbi:MAG: hypothetical protein HQL80_03205 [Magnetococcales bacterium]|nr:hypothetical protein [Magnetococcales bacterium]